MTPIFILPISGSFFPVQIRLLTDWLRVIPGAPKLCLGSSGGAIVSSFGISGDWDPDQILTNASTFNSSDIVKSPCPAFPPLVNWFITGNVVIQTSNSLSFARRLLSDKLGGTELVIGTYESSSGNPRLFSTKSKTNSVLPSISRCTYLDGNLKDISKALMASAAVPLIMPEVKVLRDEKVMFSDGGMFAPSPWSSVWMNILENTALKIVYFVPGMLRTRHAFEVLNVVRGVLDSSYIREIADLAEHFLLRGCTLKTTSVIAEVKTTYESSRECLVIIKPLFKNYVFDMLSFTGKDILHVVNSNMNIEFDVYYR